VQNQFPQAQALFEHARAIAETNRHEQYLARADLMLASVYVRVMEPDKAEKAVRAARPYFERAGQARNVAAADIFLGQILTMRAAYPAALAQIESTLAAAERVKDVEQELRAREDRATVLSAMGRYPDALAEYQHVLAAYRKSGRTGSESYALLNLSDTLSRMGRFPESAAAMRQAEAIVTPAPAIQSTMLSVRAANAYRQGRYAAAVSDARKSIAAGAGLSEERTARAHLIACAAGARLGRADAPKHCADAHVAGLERNRHLWLEVQLVDTEVKLMGGDATGAAEQLSDVLPAIEESQSAVARWRSLALLAAASPAARIGAQEKLTREFAALRALWGESTYNSWLRRADVRAMLSIASLHKGDS
jgi:hypothetical protein